VESFKAENMSDEHANALAELASDRETPELASTKEIKSLGKKNIFANANYPYKKKMARDEYEKAKKELQIELLKMHGLGKGDRAACCHSV
jgi:hypothetical protein